MSCIAIVIDTLSGGGAEQVMLRLASTMISEGYEVKFIVINPKVSHAVPDNIELIFVRDRGTARGRKWTYYRRAAEELQKVLDSLNEQQSIDAVLSNLPETDRITRHLHGYKVFHCIHNSFYHGLIKNKKGPLQRWLKKKRLQILYNHKHLIFVSEGAKEDLQQRIGVRPTTSQIIYNPFPVAEIQRLAEAGPVEYQDYFLHVGRFNRQKRHDKLLQIYSESGLTNPLLLMGEGTTDQTAAIKQLIEQYNLEDHVRLIGFKPNPFPYIRHALALLLTSDYEGLPTVVIESLICGTPAVVYDCPSGPREILTGKIREFLIPFNDSKAFIEKIKTLAVNPRRISGKQWDPNKFEAKKIVHKYMEVLQQNQPNEI